ncbi:hypothetical protein SAMN05192575_102358 [Nocardioides alpinus]|uniref:DUF6973 domain-containing protein n=1 Tax=Nocardioides alpinus TaxID=748909 RepID=A0A1I0XEQ8_9ACTN|nr:hypothetical protein [Nocardioides alpinus]PKH44311.1 hypothetical protein CXG46_01805 [Nocardioides alpinus]SFA99515.1 hypothetical protein SAMN05192575_102358 [Nocardioides alpinus]
MALGTLLDQALHSATVVPRLSAAAVRAGLGPAGTVEVLRISEAALRTAASEGRGVVGRTNALRHFMWQAVLTARFGLDAARSLAAAQEAGTPSRKDSAVDEHNNAAGQQYGAAHAAELQMGSPSEVMTLLVPVALEKWDSDELVWIRPH